MDKTVKKLLKENYNLKHEAYQHEDPLEPFLDKHNTLRFKGNKVVKFLLTRSSDKNDVDLNDLWQMYHDGLFSLDDMKVLYKLIGMSLCGYEEVSNFGYDDYDEE